MLKKMLFFGLMFVIPTQQTLADEYQELIEYRNSLKGQIETVDSEILRCEKSLKGWKTATIVGSIGAAASGIGAIIQANQIKKTNEVMNQISNEEKKSEEAKKYMQEVKK